MKEEHPADNVSPSARQQQQQQLVRQGAAKICEFYYQCYYFLILFATVTFIFPLVHVHRSTRRDDVLCFEQLQGGRNRNNS